MMSHTDTRPKNDSEKKLEATRDSSSADADVPRTKLFDAKAILWTFGKCLSALLPVYLAGYYRVSTSLVVFGMMVYAGWKHSREAKEARLRSAIQLLNDEQEHVSSKSLRSRRDLPSWVNFPDVEKVEWLNKVIHQAWPFIGQYLEKLLTETIAPSIRGSSAHLQTLSFTKIDFGDKPMKVVGVKTHTENDRGQILLDLYISYVGDVEIDVEVKRYFCKAGVKGIQLTGMMRVILEPLIGDVPIVGAVTMFFIQRPKLDINWTGLTNLLDIPGLNVMSDTMIMDAIASFLVLPNRLTVPLVPNIPVAQLRSPLPRGVVRVHLLEAEGLAVKDNYVKGVMSGMSDPYARLRVGPQTFKSRHHNNTLNPKWAEMYEFIVHEVPGQELELEVFDKDADQDDFLGRTKLDLGIVKKSKVVDEWWALQDISTGRVHLRLEWLTLDHSSERLEQVLKRNESVVSKTASPPSAAILVVYLDKAESLPRKKHDKDPNPMVQLSTQGITHESRVCWSTVNPQWEEAFTFFIKDPKNQDIRLEVKDNDRVQALGSLSVSVSPLLSSSDLSLQQWFSLADSGPESRIHVHMVLRVLWVDEDAVVSSLLSTDLGSKGHTRPLHTSPHSSFATEGVLRIHLVEAQDLVAKDNLMGGLVKGKSDPYVKFQIGGESYKSRVIKENLNPSWNEMYEVVLTTLPGQDFFLEVFDKDIDMKDDFMGRLKINLSDIIRSQYMNEWFSLSDVKHGRVHLELEWLHTLTRPEELQQVLQFQSTHSYGNKSVSAAALLFVYVERAADLPTCRVIDRYVKQWTERETDLDLKKSGKEPKVGAELILSGTSHRTTVCERTSAPQWDEAFHFLVRDPLKEELVVKLSHSWDFPLGSVVIPVKELLEEADLLVDQWLQLDGASPESQILIRAQLKILCSKEMEGPEEQRTHQPSTRTQDQKPSVAAEEEAPPRSYDLQPPHGSSTEIPEMRTDDRHLDKVPAVSISKEAEKKALKGRVMELAACTLPLSVPEEHHQPSEEHHTPAAPKAQQVEDISNIVPSSSVSQPGKTSGPEKTYYEEKHPEKATEPSAVTLPSGVPVGEVKLSGSSDVRPQKSHPDSDFGSKGALRIHLLEAQDLVAKDNLMGMVKGKSDPYVKIHIADVTIKSHVIKENLNPTWNEMYEVILSPDHEMEVKFEVYDKDVDSDDFLGRFKLKLGGIIRCQYNDEWFTLNDIKHGRVHLVLEWLPVTTQREKLDQVMQMQSVQSFQNKCVASAAMLFLFLDSAHDLPLKRSGKEPKAAAELTLGETIYKSKVCDRSSSPHWNETFHFLVPDPKKDLLVIKLSSAWEQPIGSLVLPIRELLSKSDLVLDQWLDLDGASSQSQILLRAQLKILDSKMAALLAMGSGPVLSNRLTATTGQIRLSLSFQKKLNVVVHACRALVSSCKDASDTYVSIILLPDKSKATKRKTSVKKRSLNPEFNESFEFDLSVEDVTRRELSVCVKNASTSFMNRDKDVIGQVQISLGQVDFVSGITDWFDLKEEHN